jgi:hypothetical protein
VNWTLAVFWLLAVAAFLGAARVRQRVRSLGKDQPIRRFPPRLGVRYFLGIGLLFWAYLALTQVAALFRDHSALAVAATLAILVFMGSLAFMWVLYLRAPDLIVLPAGVVLFTERADWRDIEGIDETWLGVEFKLLGKPPLVVPRIFYELRTEDINALRLHHEQSRRAA